jgi:hypothetical protein
MSKARMQAKKRELSSKQWINALKLAGEKNARIPLGRELEKSRGNPALQCPTFPTVQRRSMGADNSERRLPGFE